MTDVYCEMDDCEWNKDWKCKKESINISLQFVCEFGEYNSTRCDDYV